MSYTAPTGNTVDFTGTGVSYTAPAGNAVNFQPVQEVPTVLFQSASSVAFYGKGLLESVFALSAGSLLQADNPYRAFSIGASSSFGAKTNIRSLNIGSSSSAVMRAGVRATIDGSGVANPVGRGMFYATTAISGLSQLSGVDFWTHGVTATVITKTTTAFAGAFNADMAIRGIGKSVFSPRHIAIKNSAFAFASESSPVFDGDDWVTSPLGKTRSAFSIAGNSQFNGSCFWTHGVPFAVSNSRSVPSMIASYNKNMAMRVAGSTTINHEARPIKNAVAAFAGASGLSAKANKSIASIFGATSQSAAAFASLATCRASFSVSGSTQATGIMLRANGGATNISCGSSAAFASAMEAIDVNPVMVADYSAACLTRRNAVFVRTL